MKKMLFRLFPILLIVIVPAFPGAAHGDTVAANTAIDATTIVRFMQDERPGLPTQDQIPATQFLGIDADQLADGNASLHLYGWGRTELQDKSFNENHTDGSLTYGYAQYAFAHANARMRAGRFFINEGIVNEQVDGVSLRSDLPLGFGISAFGGATVRTEDIPGEDTDGKGDGLYGGRLNFRYGGMLELGFSGLYESAADEFTNPGNRIFANNGLFGSRRLIGGDIWFSPHRKVELMGHTSYNQETDGVAEHNYLLNIKPLPGLVLTGEFNEYRPRDLFFSSLMFSRMVTNLNEKSRTAGGRVSYELTDAIEITADYRYYTRDRGDASRFGGDVRFTILDKSVRTGLGYHYLRSGPDFAVFPQASTSGSFHEVRAYVMRDTTTYVAAVDGIGYFFKEDINNKESAWELSASLGYHLTPGLTLSGDISYGQNPQFNDEVKGLLRLSYETNLTGKGGTK